MSESETDFKLTDVERNSAAWKRLREHIEYRIDKQRRRNDARLNIEDTAHVRGSIAELKVLLELAEPEPAQVAEYGHD